ncbi:hypothetical protein Tco_1574684 [Tanacetum coccineum]
MRAEHTLEKKNELEDKCAGQANLLFERDTEIAHLKSLLSLKEAEATEAISHRGEKNALCEQVEALESAAASKEFELTSLSSHVAKVTADLSGFQLSRDELNSKVASLESERDCLVTQRSSLESAFEFFKGQVEKMQDEQRWLLNRMLKLVLSKCLSSPEYLSAMCEAIDVAAYNLSAESDYVAAINALQNVSFPLLVQLEAHKDASMEL